MRSIVSIDGGVRSSGAEAKQSLQCRVPLKPFVGGMQPGRDACVPGGGCGCLARGPGQQTSAPHKEVLDSALPKPGGTQVVFEAGYGLVLLLEVTGGDYVVPSLPIVANP